MPIRRSWPRRSEKRILKPDEKAITYCARIIRRGGLVAFPTETVYGIAANLLDKKAIDRLYKVKRRPKDKPFTIHIADAADIRKMGCKLDKVQKTLVRKFWPGPLTVILKSEDGRKLGFRMPANKIALELIRKAGVPVAAPSANLSGHRPSTSAAEAFEEIGDKVDAVLDGGQTDVGVESTVVDLTVSPPKILREGAIKSKQILKYLEYA